MDSSFEAFATAYNRVRRRCIEELQKLLQNFGFGEQSDPFAGVREPKKRSPNRGHSSVAVPEPEPESGVDAVAHR